MPKQIIPSALAGAIEALGKLPGVGVRTSERYAYFLFRSDSQTRQKLIKAIEKLDDEVAVCPVTFALMDHDQKVSPLYDDPERDKTVIAVVEEPLDIIPLEKTGQFKGTYHVLGGAISPIDGIGPEKLHIKELSERIKRDKVTEVIIATNASVEGESTALYIQKFLRDQSIDITLTRLARGLPVGVDLEYADQITLAHALEGRRSLN